MKRCLAVAILAVCGFGAEGDPKPSVEQLQMRLKSANDQIAQLEERIRLMTVQQQGAVQFFQAGQALCELDKKQSQPTKTEK